MEVRNLDNLFLSCVAFSTQKRNSYSRTKLGCVGRSRITVRFQEQPTFLSNKKFSFVVKIKKCWISRWEAEPGKAHTFSLRRPFISKRILHKAPSKVEEQPRAEISIIKNPRHPHVAVFLGVWRRYDSLSILIFPAACSDLGTLMERISDDLEDRLASTSRPGDSSELDPSTALPGRWPGPLASSSPDVKDPCLQNSLMIQSYFGCLSQALTGSYIYT